jgi:hypothetical protein
VKEIDVRSSSDKETDKEVSEVKNDENAAEEETKSISKRSTDYLKVSAKEKGCTFGTRQYKLGEVIKTGNDCIECYCSYSPIGHCIKKNKCIT